MVVEDEIVGMVKRILRGVEMTEETLGLDLIKKMAFRGDYLLDRHTRAHAARPLATDARRRRHL